MTLGLYEERARRRRGRRWALLRWVLVLSAIGAIAVFAYESGRSLAEAETAALREEMADLTASLEDSQKQRARLEVDLAEAEQARSQSETRYQETRPQGPLARVLSLVQDKLDEGITEDRLATVIAEVTNVRECDEESVTKRFLVKTALTGAENNEVRFVDGLLTVTAEGESALDGSGRPEAWFDVEKPVTLRLSLKDGESTEATGVLPLTRSVLLGDREHVFTVTAGRRGFVEVSAKSCSYP